MAKGEGLEDLKFINIWRVSGDLPLPRQWYPHVQWEEGGFHPVFALIISSNLLAAYLFFLSFFCTFASIYWGKEERDAVLDFLSELYC